MKLESTTLYMQILQWKAEFIGLLFLFVTSKKPTKLLNPYYE